MGSQPESNPSCTDNTDDSSWSDLSVAQQSPPVVHLGGHPGTSQSETRATHQAIQYSTAPYLRAQTSACEAPDIHRVKDLGNTSPEAPKAVVTILGAPCTQYNNLEFQFEVYPIPALATYRDSTARHKAASALSHLTRERTLRTAPKGCPGMQRRAVTPLRLRGRCQPATLALAFDGPLREESHQANAHRGNVAKSSETVKDNLQFSGVLPAPLGRAIRVHRGGE